jgi:hypothetical protein
MCCKCEKISLQRWGYSLTGLMIIAAAACIILAAVNYDLSSVSFNQLTAFKSLPAVEIAAIIFVFATLFLGFFTFCSANICLIIIVILNIKFSLLL